MSETRRSDRLQLPETAEDMLAWLDKRCRWYQAEINTLRADLARVRAERDAFLESPQLRHEAAVSAHTRALREALEEAVRLCGYGHRRAYSGDHWTRSVLVSELTIEQWQAALAATRDAAIRQALEAGLLKAWMDHKTDQPKGREGTVYFSLERAAEVLVPVVHQLVDEAQPQWQAIESAPKGNGGDKAWDTRDPAYIKPPHVWVLLPDGQRCVAYWDWYYAEGGNGYDGGSAWVEEFSGERVRPTHWMLLPAPPQEQP